MTNAEKKNTITLFEHRAVCSWDSPSIFILLLLLLSICSLFIFASIVSFWLICLGHIFVIADACHTKYWPMLYYWLLLSITIEQKNLITIRPLRPEYNGTGNWCWERACVIRLWLFFQFASIQFIYLLYYYN